MPIFEFQCSKCDSEFEQLVSASEKAQCPKCESNDLEKLMSASARVTSGTGLPITGQPCPPPEAGPCGTGCCRLP